MGERATLTGPRFRFGSALFGLVLIGIGLLGLIEPDDDSAAWVWVALLSAGGLAGVISVVEEILRASRSRR